MYPSTPSTENKEEDNSEGEDVEGDETANIIDTGHETTSKQKG